MTARVMLPVEDMDDSDIEWLQDLLAFDVSATAGWAIVARLKALVFLVRLYAPGARHVGPTAWPTPAMLATLLGHPPDHVLYLVTIGTAAGFLVYADDAPPVELPPRPDPPVRVQSSTARAGGTRSAAGKRPTKAGAAR